MPMNEDLELAEDEIAVQPTKALFVEMLTRDIALNRAVIDLVDNSIDGARRIVGDEGDMTGLWVTVEMNADGFSISDNCGGITIETARMYAFRFGRALGAPSTEHSVGQFGVGMKRALFKFGHEFEVVSTTRDEHFRLWVDVEAWEQDPAWTFKFSEMRRAEDNPQTSIGTVIRVSRLRESVAASFVLEAFRKSLAREIQAAQQSYIDRGLQIKFDQRTLIASPWKLQVGNGLVPIRTERVFAGGSAAAVILRLFVGVGPSDPTAAGWYVACNGRLVLEADQSAATGWSRLGANRITIPKYHNQFARFRGYALFDSSDAGRLPWNTTKSGIDIDSELYRAALLDMIDAMRPVIDFLNDVDSEIEGSEPGPRQALLDRTPSVPLLALGTNPRFVAIPTVAPKGPPKSRISFERLTSEVLEMREAFSVSSNRAVGEKAFDRAYQQLMGPQ